MTPLVPIEDVKMMHADLTRDITRLTDSLKQWDELRKAVANMLGEDPNTWPDHGNAPLAISAAFALRVMRLENSPNSPELPADKEAMLTKVAALCHEQWAGWMKYLFGKCTPKDDGTFVIPSWAVERWSRQTKTPYSELSLIEQESDLTEARKFLKVIYGS